jgi:hypothetical protein
MSSTYEKIATTTLGSTTTDVTFSTISGSYTDLVLVVNSKSVGGTGQEIIIRFNSDTGNNYSFTYLYGNGTTAASGRASNTSSARLGYFTVMGTNEGYMGIAQIMNYSNTTTNKTMITRSNSNSSNSSNLGTEYIVNLWRDTSAITTVLVSAPSVNFAAGSTFTLYGIKAE